MHRVGPTGSRGRSRSARRRGRSRTARRGSRRSRGQRGREPVRPDPRPGHRAADVVVRDDEGALLSRAASRRAASRGAACEGDCRRSRRISGSSRDAQERRRDQARVRRQAQELAGEDARGLTGREAPEREADQVVVRRRGRRSGSPSAWPRRRGGAAGRPGRRRCRGRAARPASRGRDPPTRGRRSRRSRRARASARGGRASPRRARSPSAPVPGWARLVIEVETRDVLARRRLGRASSAP